MQCVFCESGEVRKRLIVENTLAWAVPTNIPIVPGHVLVLPKRCVSTLEELSLEELQACIGLLRSVKEALRKTFGVSDFNHAWNEGKEAGQSVPHLHIHVLPRQKGDTGITTYEPRTFLYRPGSRAETPEEELLLVAEQIRSNIVR